MYYRSLKLKGYTRIAISGYTDFEIDFTDPLQVILGTNGVGKSSVLSEISPMPASPVDFLKTGSKEIIIDNDGQHYTLTSVFSPQQKHSFIWDDQELNPGGTQTVQRELIKQHFCLDNDTNNLLQNRDRFTSMSTAKRKDWFIRLCDTNYDFALKTFNKVREKLRDAQGAIKITQNRLLVETEKLLENEEEKTLRNECQALHEVLGIFTEHRKPIEESLESLEHTQTLLDTRLKKQAQQMQMLYIFAAEYGLDINETNNAIVNVEKELIKANALLENVSQTHQEIKEKTDVLKRAEAKTIEELAYLVKTTEEDLLKIEQKLMVPVLSDPFAVSSALASVQESLLEVFTQLPPNPNQKYSSIALDNSQTKKELLKIKYAKHLETTNTLNQKLKHLLHHQEKPNLECPKCQHFFSTFYSKAEHETVLINLEKADLRTKELLSEIEELDTFVQNCSEYARLFRQYLNTVRHWPILKPYWTLLDNSGLMQTMPANASVMLLNWQQDVPLHARALKIGKELLAKKELLLDMRNVGTSDLQALLAQQTSLEEKIEIYTSKLQKLTSVKTDLQQAKVRLLAFQNYDTLVKSTIREKMQLHTREQETIRLMHLHQVIRSFQSSLATREHRLQSLALQRGVVAALEGQLSDYKNTAMALGILAKELSPTEGIIAEGLMQFMRKFVGQMNQLVEQVWTYPMKIEACDFAQGDLDYRFPMRVGTDQSRVSDVSKGSEGMLEILNFAFVLVAKRYLHLNNHPVYLDEFSSAMDTAHKANAVYLIRQLLNSAHTKQVFMISHDYTQYTAISNAQVCVLCPDNIVTPAVYNQHVVLH